MGETDLLCFWEQRLYILLGIRSPPCGQSRETGRDVYSKRRNKKVQPRPRGLLTARGSMCHRSDGRREGWRLPEPLAKHLSSDILEGQGMS